MRDCEGYSMEKLFAERFRLRDCIQRSNDTFSKMLLTGQIGMIDREIAKREAADAAQK